MNFIWDIVLQAAQDDLESEEKAFVKYFSKHYDEMSINFTYILLIAADVLSLITYFFCIKIRRLGKFSSMEIFLSKILRR